MPVRARNRMQYSGAWTAHWRKNWIGKPSASTGISSRRSPSAVGIGSASSSCMPSAAGAYCSPRASRRPTASATKTPRGSLPTGNRRSWSASGLETYKAPLQPWSTRFQAARAAGFTSLQLGSSSDLFLLYSSINSGCASSKLRPSWRTRPCQPARNPGA